MSDEADLLGEFEVHSAEGIRKVLARGVSPVAPIKGKRPIDWLIEMYPRSKAFPDCLRVMLEAGGTIDDPLVEAVLLDDEVALRRLVVGSAESLTRQVTILSAFTSCDGVTALHLCAEFNSIRCARVLLSEGADVNAKAAADSEGVGGQTPIFHAVNSIHNHCRPMMELLADRGADLEVRLKAVIWGDTMPWETVVFDVSPISYAQCGLYRQFHRREEDIFDNIGYLSRRLAGPPVTVRNVPNQYLSG